MFPVTMESIPPKCHWWSSFDSGMNRGFDIQDGGDCCKEEYADSIQSQLITMSITYRPAACKRLAFDFGMTCFVAATGEKDSCIDRSSQLTLVFANGRQRISFRRPSFVPNMENTGRLRTMPYPASGTILSSVEAEFIFCTVPPRQVRWDPCCNKGSNSSFTRQTDTKTDRCMRPYDPSTSP